MKRLNKVLLGSLVALFLLGASGPSLAVEVVNLMVSKTGMQRITYQQLANAGVDLAGLKHDYLAITLGEQSVALHSQGQDKKFGKKKRFGPGGYLEFYGESADSQYTDDVAYTLHVDKDLRVDIPSSKAKFKKKYASATDYRQSIVVEENVYYDFLSPSKTDPFHYGQVLGAGAVNGPVYNFELDEVSRGVADFSVEVFGIVDLPGDGNDHHVEILINGKSIGDEQFDGSVTAYITASDVAVLDGSNSLQFNLKGIADMPFDAAALNETRISYARNTVAKGDYLQGRFAAGQATASGFTTDDINLYRLAGKVGIERIEGAKNLGDVGGLHQIGFGVGEHDAEVILVAGQGYKQPSVAMIEDLDDISTGSAEYLIIAHKSFMGPELDGLVQIRQADYSVKVVDVAQVYGQFGAHVPSADAVHAYIKHAAANMGTRYVVLIGGDTYDYKGFVSNSISFIPTLYVTTPAGSLNIAQTPSDVKYGDLDDDNVPDIAVGRIPARTPQELGYVVEKIRDYRARVGYTGRIMMAADKEDVGNGLNFTEDANALINAISDPLWRNSVLGTNRSFFRAYPDVDGEQLAHTKLITGLNSGVSVAAYIGHSSQSSWAFTTPIMLTTADVSNLTNLDKPTLVTQWGCWNTYFVDPAGNSLGDEFLLSGETGAVTVLGASTLTSSSGERKLGIELNQRMYHKGATIGDAIVQAKQAMAANSGIELDILLGWQIMGDPALVINP